MNQYKIILLALILIWGCGEATEEEVKEVTGKPQFELLQEGTTGLNFRNVQKQNIDFNLFTYMYFFNGGGVAAGDFNQDGLQDLFFTSNMSANGLFLNKGNFKFEDVTAIAKLEGAEGWATGTSVVDINNDGLLDIYVSHVGKYEGLTESRNQLYVCVEVKDGVPVFEEKAAEYGLDLVGFGTQATFFDYDKDGDLDMFQLNHSVHHNGTFGPKKKWLGTYSDVSGDKLMRNDNGKFVDVTKQSGIHSSVIGYGLGLSTGDINNDGWTDIYIGNDFHEDDYLYINQGDGTFKDMLAEQINNTSRFSMGVEIGDLNNDGNSEIFSLDMAPYDPYILKSSLGEDGYDIYSLKLGYGYQHQYARNTLQLNNGDGTFSEIGRYADVFATDWSWSTLMMDFDHDGYKDIFVSNGIPRRMNDIDYMNFRLGDEDFRVKSSIYRMEDEDLEIADKMPQIKLPNQFLRNNRQLKFENLEPLIKNDVPSYSNGAAYVDLDNDGDLDIVTNNIDAAPFVYRNLTTENEENGNYLALKLKGSPKNINAIGASVIVKKRDGTVLKQEHFPVRGFQSTVQMGLHIGLGDAIDLYKIYLIWQDGTYEEVPTTEINRTVSVEWKMGLPKWDYSILGDTQKPTILGLKDITTQAGIDFKHEENDFVEFNRERLMPHMVSREGPAVAVGDVNGDGLEDVFLGNAKRERPALYLQQTDGSFLDKTPNIILNDSTYEDVDAIFVDIENDGDLDLIVAAGGNEYRGKAKQRQQRTYINDGKGNFERKDIFDATVTASCVLASDYNGDGLVDFFIGGRAIPYKYGLSPKSFLYLNKGNGQFENVAAKQGLEEVGMVNDGVWADIDGDGDQDLVLAIEWQPVTIFLNKNGNFKKQVIGQENGWWKHLQAEDFDGDGDVDLIAGNLGENTKLKPTKNEPISLFINDFDENEQIEQVMTYYVGGREIPFATHTELTMQLPPLKKDYLMSKDMAEASIMDLFGKEKLDKSIKLEANQLKSVYYENTGNGVFQKVELPAELQFSTIGASAVVNQNNGGTTVLMGGNFHDCNIEMGRYAASYGQLLYISKDGQLSSSRIGGVSIRGQIRGIEPIKIGNKKAFIVVRNDDSVRVLSE